MLDVIADGLDDSTAFIGIVNKKFIFMLRVSNACKSLESDGSIAAMTVQEIIRKLGGPVAVGRHLEIRSQAVSHWSTQNRIPAERVPQLVRLARKMRVKVTATQMRPDLDWAALK